MSSATKSKPVEAYNLAKNIDVEAGMGGPTDAQSQRQKDLERYWRFYRCSNYDGRKCDWNGQEAHDSEEHERIATAGFLPPGFYDAGQTLPVKFRKPTVPYYLSRVVVNRFTSLLFSSSRHPRIKCDDPKTEDWLQGFAEAVRLWPKMIQARTFGGATGSVGIGFKFINGVPKIEVHDPRYCTPEFEDTEDHIVSSFEKRYQYPIDIRNRKGEIQQKWFWYRRIIDETADTIWDKIPVEEEEPDWETLPFKRVLHNFGFCPVVWIQNQTVDNSIDGDPDCFGCYEFIEGIDALYSQAHRGVLANCDPTTIIESEAEFEDIKKGTGSALQVEKGGSVKYLEMTGEGIERALKLADTFEKRVQIVARCQLETNMAGPARTVEEVEHNYSSMIEQADIYREQYGEMGIKRLLSLVIRAIKRLQTPQIEKIGDSTRIIRRTVKLPKRKVITEDGTVAYQERELGNGEQIDLLWPPRFTPSQEMVAKAVEAANKAKAGGLIDEKHAAEYVSSYFQVENIIDMLVKMKAEQEEQAEEAAEQAILRQVPQPKKPGKLDLEEDD